MCCKRLAANTGHKKWPSRHHRTTMSGNIFATKACIDNRKKISTGFASWQRYCTASSSGHQPNFAALNRGRHLCLAGRPSGWALAHILVVSNGLMPIWLTLHKRARESTGITRFRSSLKSSRKSQNNDLRLSLWLDPHLCKQCIALHNYHLLLSIIIASDRRSDVTYMKLLASDPVKMACYHQLST